ncbi:MULTISPECIES: DNA recombination protein RmuC [unclassified Tatumella]|uniref:DNA recombination protein RmuC n=1 Tax=unclassified Tatumella TaxID=2649542 RepID=UPI001BB01322|nr:DNA recombination protein RmuC [Tatumella sp. JGM16]MBS0913903.1 DNA recombination protein RmuC [Tatumella sp. JGM91]
MDTQLIISGCLLLGGAGLGWLVAVLRSGHQLAAYAAEQRVRQETVDQLQQVLGSEQQSGRQKDLELRQLHGTVAAQQEKLQQLTYWREQSEQLSQELRHQADIYRAQEAELREVTTRLEDTRLAAEEKQRVLINSEQRLAAQFENLAGRIFEHSGRRFDEQNRQSLQGLLTPLREQLDGFRRQINDSFSSEARERHTLTHEIRQLQKLNSQMAQEAVNLTRALKGDNKTQGNWGEVILARVLEASGLREGYEYETQVSIQRNDGRYQPDVIVHLPQNKDVVIDAKMTLVAYERYFNAEDDLLREQAAREHISAMRNHLRLLSRKDYQQLPGVKSLDYVLMFIPVEPAFLLALDREPELVNEALQQNIMLVSPTTLLVALRTISNLWRYEHQSQNARDIAEKAGRLYDKMRLFVDDMQSMGNHLDKARDSYQQSMKKLTEGRGNLVARAEAFRHMGVEVRRPIDPKITAKALSFDLPPEDDPQDGESTLAGLQNTWDNKAPLGNS